jgi:hypothetical protein
MLHVMSQIITFTTAPVALSFTDGAGNAVTRLQRLYIEPLTSNSHDAFVEIAGTGTGASGNTQGVVKRLSKPPAANAGTVVDFWEVSTQGHNGIDALQFTCDGTSGEGVRVTAYA